MKNKRLVMQSTIFAVGLISLTLPIHTNMGGVKADELKVKVNMEEVMTEPMLDSMEIPNIIFVEPNDTPVVKLEPEIVAEEVVDRPYNYYRVNDNGCYAQLDLKLQDFLWEMCEKYDICEHYELIMAQMFSESSFRADLVSGTNDYGLMQINKCNHEWLSEKLGSNNFKDPYISIEAGCIMMSTYLHKYDEARALVAYNSGESIVKKGTSSTKYSDKVLSNMKKLEIIDKED